MSVVAPDFFIKPTKSTVFFTSFAFGVFCVVLLVLWGTFGVSPQLALSLFIGGFASMAVELAGATAKRIGTKDHVLCVAGFYCGIWLVIAFVDWLFFAGRFYAWLG